MYKKSGLKQLGMLFLLTEGQIVNEKFLVYINDLLSSGEITDLFPEEDIDNIVAGCQNAAKAAGYQTTREGVWNFYIARIKELLHMSLCFSPVGDGLRNKAKKFPALVNCTVIDWFQEWPYDALKSVSKKFLDELDLGEESQKEAILEFMPFSFTLCNKYSGKIFETDRRFV